MSNNGITRRELIVAASGAAIAGGLASRAAAQGERAAATGYDGPRIATEEAFATRAQFDAMRRLVEDNPQVTRFDYTLWRMLTSGNYHDDTPRRLLDLEDERLERMDANGISMQLLLLTSPGVQLLPADVAVGVAEDANDQVAEVIGRHPDRFAGLAAVAPQSPDRAAREIERAVSKLGLNGVVINSHTNNEYLDDRKYWPILEAAEAMDAPIYIHPRSPSDQMRGAFDAYNMQSAFWGYGMDTSTHAVRIIMSGALDRFPKLRFVLGHMGEGVHFWFYRLDYMSAPAVSRGESTITMLPSEYFIRNFRITTSGQQSDEALRYSINVLGVDNVMWAVDYPYQEMPEAVEWMDATPVSDAEREAIYYKNAAREFKL